MVFREKRFSLMTTGIHVDVGANVSIQETVYVGRPAIIVSINGGNAYVHEVFESEEDADSGYKSLCAAVENGNCKVVMGDGIRNHRLEVM